jgi:hypothetical protein
VFGPPPLPLPPIATAVAILLSYITSRNEKRKIS